MRVFKGLNDKPLKFMQELIEFIEANSIKLDSDQENEVKIISSTETKKHSYDDNQSKDPPFSPQKQEKIKSFPNLEAKENIEPEDSDNSTRIQFRLNGIRSKF